MADQSSPLAPVVNNNVDIQSLVNTMQAGNNLLAQIATLLAGITTTGGVVPGFVSVPASDSAPGVAGSLAYESGWLYVCVATDTWERVAIAGGF